MKRILVLGLTLTSTIILFSSCAKCSTCENEKTGDVDQICREAGSGSGQKTSYDKAIKAMESKGYICTENE
jgi:hypothetical protein